MVTVMNLCNSEKFIYNCNPLMAVICAYAQSKKDFNTRRIQRH